MRTTNPSWKMDCGCWLQVRPGPESWELPIHREKWIVGIGFGFGFGAAQRSSFAAAFSSLARPSLSFFLFICLSLYLFFSLSLSGFVSLSFSPKLVSPGQRDRASAPHWTSSQSFHFFGQARSRWKFLNFANEFQVNHSKIKRPKNPTRRMGRSARKKGKKKATTTRISTKAGAKSVSFAEMF